MNFLPIFSEVHHKNEQSTSETIPDCARTLHPKIKKLLDEPHPISVITGLVHSDVGRKFIRAILLQYNQQMDVVCQEHGSGALMYEKVHTGYTADGETFNWIYFQNDESGFSSVTQMISTVSCTLIFEASNLETDGIFLHKVVNNFKRSTGRFPIVYILNNEGQIIPKSPYQQLIIPSSWLKATTQTIQGALQQGRRILTNTFVLQSKGKPISCAVLPLYFTKWEQQSSSGETISPQNVWSSAIQSLQQQIKNKCVHEYRARMGKLYEDKKFISIKLLRNSHEMSMQIAMKSVEKYQISQAIMEELEQVISRQLNQIMQQIMEINEKWGRNFVETQFIQIQNRLKNKQLKLMLSLKHEFYLFTEYFHKKAEPLGCKKLEYFFVNFITEKAFDFASFIFESDIKTAQTEVVSLKTKLTEKENQLKQVRRQISKQNSDTIKSIQNLQQTIIYHKNRSQLLENTINQLKSDRELLESEHDNRMQELERSFLAELNKQKEQKYLLGEQLAAGKRKIAVLESEISKEKEMHKQTSEHYRAMVGQFKVREEELKAQIEDITLRAGQELQIYKRDTQRSLNQSSVSKNEKQREGMRLVQEMRQLSKKYGELQKAYGNMEYQLQLNKAEQEIIKNDMEISLKLAEQKVCQYQSRLPRYKKFEQQVESHQKLIEQYNEQQKEAEKVAALLRQQNNFLIQQIKQLEHKCETEKRSSLEMKIHLQELQEKVGKLDKVKVNEWVQTQYDGKFKSMLEEALKMVSVLEVEYGKVKLENTRLRYKLNDY